MAKYVLILIVLSFTLTTTASAAMMCCWNMGQDEAAADMPCHPSDDADKSDTAPLDCCDDMTLCKVPLVYGSADTGLDMMQAHNDARPTFSEWVLADSTGPPPPPPKQFL